MEKIVMIVSEWPKLQQLIHWYWQELHTISSCLNVPL
uniref:Uncharacterized protein n=1 Tax=Arundo donax TaxID=35708 RepID=A0A0A9EHG7_ARUDO